MTPKEIYYKDDFKTEMRENWATSSRNYEILNKHS